MGHPTTITEKLHAMHDQMTALLDTLVQGRETFTAREKLAECIMWARQAEIPKSGQKVCRKSGKLRFRRHDSATSFIAAHFLTLHDLANLHAYRCDDCGGFHIGHYRSNG